MDDVLAKLDALTLRGKVSTSRMGARTKINFTGLDNEAGSNIELLLPPGFVANPRPGADVLLKQVGTYDHRIALGGDHTMDRVGDLQPGEAGLSTLGQTFLVRVGATVSITPLLQWGAATGELKRLVTETFMQLFNEHTHPIPSGGNTEAPTQQMTADNLTGGS